MIRGYNWAEIIVSDDPKRKCFACQDKRTRNKWRRKDTVKSLHVTKMNVTEQMGIDASCIMLLDKKTASIYRSALRSAPEIVH